MNIHGPHQSITAETLVPAQPDEVWRAWTTEAGLRTFFSPYVEIELRIGGAFHILFNMDAPPGLRGADDMRIMAIDPGKMLAFDWNAPPQLPDIRPQRTHVCVYFEGTCGGDTRVTLVHDGWGLSEPWEAAVDYFSSAWNEVVLPRLRWRFEHGPVDSTHRPDVSLQARKGRLLQIYDAEQRVAQVYPHVERSESMGVLRSYVPAEKRGFIAYSHLRESGVDRVIQDQVNYFKQKQAGFEWKVYDHDTPANLKERLSDAGFVPEEAEALMVMEIDSAPEGFFDPGSLDLRRISRPEGIADVQLVEETVYGREWDNLLVNLRKDLTENPDLVSVYAGYSGGRPVACAWTYFHPGTHFASFWGGSTIQEFRSQGFYTALLAVRAREARQRGFKYLTVDAGPMSRPILEKHGFLCLTYSTPYNWSP